ncbi:MAG TPA: RidA family protein [Kiloniellaceae bacterium]|nr:RidA family protein [Kiloniellaceae bacterium]
MRILHTPGGIAPPFSRYSHGVEAKNVSRWLSVSGQVGVASDGNLAEGAAAQMEQAWRNIFEVLASAQMAPENLVKITAFLTSREDLSTFREVRDRLLGAAQPASSLVVVAGLADPAWLVEIEALAAA